MFFGQLDKSPDSGLAADDSCSKYYCLRRSFFLPLPTADSRAATLSRSPEKKKPNYSISSLMVDYNNGQDNSMAGRGTGRFNNLGGRVGINGTVESLCSFLVSLSNEQVENGPC